jgi:hypothetical protein
MDHVSVDQRVLAAIPCWIMIAAAFNACNWGQLQSDSFAVAVLDYHHGWLLSACSD